MAVRVFLGAWWADNDITLPAKIIVRIIAPGADVADFYISRNCD